MSLLEVEKLSISVIKKLPGGKIISRNILENASFSLEKGCVLGILGESGSGKTLIALTLSGLLARGVIVHGGIMKFNSKKIDLTKNSNSLHSLRGRGILLLPQSPSGALNPYRSVGSQIKEVNPVIDIKALLETFGIPSFYASKNPSTLSGGMKRRILLATAIALKPSLLILDEPTEGLDPVTKWEMVSLIGSMIKSMNTGVILITHDIESLAGIEKMVGESRFSVAILRRGILTIQGSVRELMSFLSIPHPFNPNEFPCEKYNDKQPRSELLFELEAAEKEYPPGLKALDHVFLSLREGELGGVIGRSGAGKTTLLRCIAGIEPLTAGNFRWKGIPLNPFPYRLRGEIHMLFQDPYMSLNPYLTALEIICEPFKRKGNPCEVRRVIEMLETDEEFLQKYPWELSGGQCQKVALARALVSGPKLLLADEPLSGLFSSDKQKLTTVLKKLCKEGDITLLVASHDLGIIKTMVDKVWVMDKGRIVEYDSTGKIFSCPSHPETATLLEFGRRFSWISHENIL